MVRRVWQFLSADVWDLDLRSLSAWKRQVVRLVRVVQLVFGGFREDECPLHASALTFSTLLSLVPVLALSLALARGLGGAEIAQNRIRSAVAEWTASFAEPVAAAVSASTMDEPAGGEGGREPAPAGASGLAAQINRMTDEVLDKVDNINFGALGGVGLVALLVMVVQVLGQVEASFNRVWGIASGRPLLRRFTDYVSALVILPLLMVAASSIPAADFVTRFLPEGQALFLREILSSEWLRRATVFGFTTLCFWFLLALMPNTRVRAVSGLTGGLITAMLFIGWLRICAALQVGVMRNSAIYGSFALLPIVLFWVYVSWQIVLLGAEVAFAVQNAATYRMETGARRASMYSRILLALAVMDDVVRCLREQRGAWVLADFVRHQRVPVRFLNDVVEDLVQAGFLAELAGEPGRFVPARAPEAVNSNDIACGLLAIGVPPEGLNLGRLDETVRRRGERILTGLSGAAS